jgi:hypothetical protein
MNELSQHPDRRQPRDPRTTLSEAAQARIDKALNEGSQARRQAELAFRWADPETRVALECATFDYAFRYLIQLRAELKRAGSRGERLREMLAEEIEAIVNGIELGDSAEAYFRELLFHDWGW